MTDQDEPTRASLREESAALAADADTTDYLFASPANARRLRDAAEALDEGEGEEHDLDRR